MFNLEWIKCSDGNWCNLLGLNLGHSHFNNLEGVYIIWHAGINPATVKVGQGVIKDRLTSHKSDRDILAYKLAGLFVTWASVPFFQRDGIERYLGDRLSPKVGSSFPDAIPIPVNLPW